MLLVEAANEVAQLRTQHAFERAPLGPDHVHLDPPRAERRGDLESHEARAQDDRAPRPVRRLDDRATVGQGAQVVHGRAGLERGHPAAEYELDLPVPVVGARVERELLLPDASGQVVLGEIRPVTGRLPVTSTWPVRWTTS